MSLTSLVKNASIGALGMLVSAGGVGLVNTQARVTAVETHQADSDKRLDRIEDKVDKLLEFQHIPHEPRPKE